MLPLLGVLVFAIAGIAALSVDTGLAFSAQARLASATSTLALERARFVEEEIAAGRNPDDPNGGWEPRATLLLETLLGAAAIGTTDPGTGLRLETVTQEEEEQTWTADADGVRTEATLRGHTPLLFGMAALLPTRLLADGSRQGALSLSELNAKRAAGDLTPQLSSGGLRSTGFSPTGSAAVASAPIVRVGAPNVDLELPGLAPVALFQNAGGAIADGAVIAGDEAVVGCVIDSQRTASVGQTLSGATDPTNLPPPAPELTFYAPLVDGTPETTPCAPAPIGRIVGFLPVSLVGSAVRVLDSAEVERPLLNASTVPAGITAAPASASVPGLLRGPSLALPAGGAGG